MVHAGFAMLNAVYGDVQLNSLTMDKGHKSKLHCHCSVPVVHSSRRDPLATCQLLCGNSKKLNTVSCNFCITLKPINFLEMIPALFVYEIEETGEVFTSFRINPIKVVAIPRIDTCNTSTSQEWCFTCGRAVNTRPSWTLEKDRLLKSFSIVSEYHQWFSQGRWFQ